MRLTWATDIHLDFITNPKFPESSKKNIDVFCDLVKSENSDALILSGDISLASYLQDHLFALESRLRMPIYFVLGNHDFWGGSFAGVRRAATNVANASDYLKYLSSVPYIPVSPGVALVGHDGWYDGLYGNPYATIVTMNDWSMISDFYKSSHGDNSGLDEVLKTSQVQSYLSTRHVAEGIKKAIRQQSLDKIIIVTHVPPFTAPLDLRNDFKESIYPWYASKMMGDMILSAAKNNPHIDFEVFCGHVHTKFDGRISSNVYLHSGHAEYSKPLVQNTFVI